MGLSLQADRRWSATSFGTTASQSGDAAGQHPNNGQYDGIPSRTEQRQAPFWQEEAAGFPSSTALSASQHPPDLGMAQPAGAASRAAQRQVGPPFATAEEGEVMGYTPQHPHVHSAAARTPMHAAGRRSSQSISPPFARAQDATSHGLMRATEPQHMSAPACGNPRHAAGRHSRNSISPPFATADDSALLGQSEPQPQTREVSPPYATQEDAYLGTSADAPVMRAQAQAILHGSSACSTAPQGHPGTQQESTKQHALLTSPSVPDSEQEMYAQDADRADSVDESVSSRHTTTGFRPYANEASLQVRCTNSKTAESSGGAYVVNRASVQGAYRDGSGATHHSDWMLIKRAVAPAGLPGACADVGAPPHDHQQRDPAAACRVCANAGDQRRQDHRRAQAQSRS